MKDYLPDISARIRLIKTSGLNTRILAVHGNLPLVLIASSFTARTAKEVCFE